MRLFFLLTTLLQTAFLFSTAAFGQAETLVGHWQGAYVRMGAVQSINVDLFIQDRDLKGTYDIPDLSIYGEPVTDLEISYPRLKFKPKHGVFEMIFDETIGEMTGSNTRWNPPVSLHLKRSQKQPLAYTYEDIYFKKDSVKLAGRIFKPLKPGRYPAVIVIHGSGEQGIGDNFYNFWGRFFANQGMVAFIYDKRGVGRSTGDHKMATFEDLAGDALAAASAIRSRKEVDPDRIGIMGISQGGWIAPLAASRSKDVKFLILNVGPSVTVEEQELHRVEYSLRADEIPKADIEMALEYTRMMFRTAYSGEGWGALAQTGVELKGKPWAEKLSIAETSADLAGWKRIRYDPAPVLKRTKIPLLALYGENDTLVPPEENIVKMESYLKIAGNRDFTIRVIPNAGHDMESFGTLKGGEWKWPENHWVWPKKSPVFYQTIIEWLDTHVKIPSIRQRQ